MHKAFEVITDHYILMTHEQTLNNQFKGIYVTDLLSTAIKHIKDQEALITIIATHTTISLAMMLDIKVILFPMKIDIDEHIIKKANEEDIALIKSDLLTHEVIIDLYKRGLI